MPAKRKLCELVTHGKNESRPWYNSLSLPLLARVKKDRVAHQGKWSKVPPQKFSTRLNFYQNFHVQLSWAQLATLWIKERPNQSWSPQQITWTSQEKIPWSITCVHAENFQMVKIPSETPSFRRKISAPLGIQDTPPPSPPPKKNSSWYAHHLTRFFL